MGYGFEHAPDKDAEIEKPESVVILSNSQQPYGCAKVVESPHLVEIAHLKAELRTHKGYQQEWMDRAFAAEAEIERLKVAYEQVLAMYDRSRAKVEKLDLERSVLREALSGARAERDYLETENNELRNDGMQLRNEIERLKGMILTPMLVDTLRTRVEELEVVRDSYQTDWQLAVKERDELREKLAEAEASLDYATSERIRLADKVRELEPKQPTIVRQTWQNIYSDGQDWFEEHDSLIRARTHGYGAEEFIAVLRRDHYSDGAVRCELESV